MLIPDATCTRPVRLALILLPTVDMPGHLASPCPTSQLGVRSAAYFSRPSSSWRHARFSCETCIFGVRFRPCHVKPDALAVLANRVLKPLMSHRGPSPGGARAPIWLVSTVVPGQTQHYPWIPLVLLRPCQQSVMTWTCVFCAVVCFVVAVARFSFVLAVWECLVELRMFATVGK